MTVKQQFGGDWTEQKLGVLADYLNAYTHALKKTPFKLMYIDAFAGTGYRQLSPPSGESAAAFSEFADIQTQQFLDGSVRKALKVRDREFDEFILIEKDPVKCLELGKLKAQAGLRRFDIENGDANVELTKLVEQTDWRLRRAVLFLDPFATQLDWKTIEAVAKTGAIDTWILFPIHIIQRLLPREARPETIDPKWAQSLDRIFGTHEWSNRFYSQKTEESLFGPEEPRDYRRVDSQNVINYFLERLGTVFAGVAPKAQILRNRSDSPLFAFCFAVGSQAGKPIALRIANHLIERL